MGSIRHELQVPYSFGVERVGQEVLYGGVDKGESILVADLCSTYCFDDDSKYEVFSPLALL